MRIYYAHDARRIATMSSSGTPPPARPKRAVNLTVGGDLLEAAREEGVNLSATLERALEEELRALKRRRWRTEHEEAIEAYNEHVGRHGPALAGTRAF
jgi:antitoxin CcdA